jgi:Zn-dependent protease
MPAAMRTVRYRYTYQPAYRPKGLSFGRTELMHITIAVLVLTVAFALAFSDFFFYSEYYFRNPIVFVDFLLAAFIAVGTGFLFHELAHKKLAQMYGCWAEFRSDRFGLVIALVTSLFGFVFAAPGAVYIAGRINKEQNGKISLVGPMTNVMVALSFMGLFYLLVATASGWLDSEPFVKFLLPFVAQVNLFLAGFNLIPFMPLDGAKVAHWNIGIWVGAIALVVLLYVFFFII